MKKWSMLIICTLIVLLGTYALADVDIDETHFPDELFRDYIRTNFDKDGNGSLSDAEIAEVTDINVSGNMISDLTGIENFSFLTDLSCENCILLSSINLSRNPKLRDLDCNGNRIESVDLSQNMELRILLCRNNQLTSLDLSHNTQLIQLYCNGNKLTSLDLSSNTNLEHLQCHNNLLVSLNVKNNTKLHYIECEENKLTSIDVSACKALDTFYCDSNNLTELDVSSNPLLTQLTCHGNQLTSLDVTSCSILGILHCPQNRITDLKVTGLKKLVRLNCFSNRLTSLDLRGCTLLHHLVTSAARQEEKWDSTAKYELGSVSLSVDAFTDIIHDTGTIPASQEPTEIIINGLNYKLDKKKTATLTGLEDKNAAKINIPATIKVKDKTYKVTEIGDNALKGCTNLKELTIGKNITKIGKNACYNCKNLKKITIKTKKLSKTSIGKNAFKNTYKKATFKCPKGKAKEYEEILKGKGASKKAKFK